MAGADTRCFQIPSALGICEVRLDARGAVTRLDIGVADRLLQPPRGPEAGRVAAWLRAYLAGDRPRGDVSLAPGGTVFQQRVWAALRRIPAGEVRCYGDLARELDTSPRAVGQACRHNPIPILIPCHRVVAVAGIGGFAGARSGPLVGRKRWLLEHEGWRG